MRRLANSISYEFELVGADARLPPPKVEFLDCRHTFEEEMNFGPAEMAQTMEAAQGLIVVTMVYSVGFGIVVGAIVALFRQRAADQSFRERRTVPL